MVFESAYLRISFLIIMRPIPTSGKGQDQLRERTVRISGPSTVDGTLLDKGNGSPSAHLRVHGAPMDATLILRRGETRMGDERPERLPYLFLKRDRDGHDLESAFVLAYEPYSDTPFLPTSPLMADVSGDGLEIRLLTRSGEEAGYRFGMGNPAGPRWPSSSPGCLSGWSSPEPKDSPRPARGRSNAPAAAPAKMTGNPSPGALSYPSD